MGVLRWTKFTINTTTTTLHANFFHTIATFGLTADISGRNQFDSRIDQQALNFDKISAAILGAQNARKMCNFL